MEPCRRGVSGSCRRDASEAGRAVGGRGGRHQERLRRRERHPRELWRRKWRRCRWRRERAGAGASERAPVTAPVCSVCGGGDRRWWSCRELCVCSLVPRDDFFSNFTQHAHAYKFTHAGPGSGRWEGGGVQTSGRYNLEIIIPPAPWRTPPRKSSYRFWNKSLMKV